ncbi:Glycerophosphodiester phosphodiesterase [Imperialibacter sp. EC-SDR9]|uniref:glycerophosphodiester phosphodiesterase family protein n=2 Tax=Imperialibacter TaxID=1649461 RepID=UPI00125380AB|nr:glycerophosphodiester phosphodiesterase family protein [Imperialibacter sp. 89]CAD5248576.1 Glycerophosphodiester phosphodiesterase [Imperialibacter sp. 75]CAD5248733.1 Glycerophosphodiester phosphodiesterase [Imperialibacter sp. 89]VVS97858.1 Glycerophosphodiester phosphodiesterase [Imperialibacter sp. EC-SDR9]
MSNISTRSYSKMMRNILCFGLAAFLFSCTPQVPSFDWQGHRGARGLMPENTIPAFLKAMEYDIKTLEMDVVITADNMVVVSHDSFLSPTFCTDSLGNSIAEGSEMKWNIYQMRSDELAMFDCGSKLHPGFPDQEKMSVNKPLLSEVFKAVDQYADDKGLNIPFYNIELKSDEEGDHIYHPEPSVFCELVYAEINGKVPFDKLTIQSFDFRILRYFHETYPEVKLSVLIGNDLSVEENLSQLGFIPAVYSCYFKKLTPDDVTLLHGKGLQVIPWTVNEVKEMQELIKMGVDGIITDYPNLIEQVAS